MRRRSVHELIVGAARGEPLPLEERARLDAALVDDAELQAELRAQQALGVELAALRRALEELPLPTDEAPLLTAYRATVAKRGQHRRRRLRQVAGAAAGAAAVALSAGLWLGSSEPPAPVPPAAGTMAAVTPAAEPAVFRALPYAAAPSPYLSYSVVRVRIPWPALAGNDVAPADETVEADVLIGEDGLISAIRFDRTGTVLVSMDSR